MSSDDIKTCIGLQAATLYTEFQSDQTLGLQVGLPCLSTSDSRFYRNQVRKDEILNEKIAWFQNKVSLELQSCS